MRLKELPRGAVFRFRPTGGTRGLLKLSRSQQDAFNTLCCVVRQGVANGEEAGLVLVTSAAGVPVWYIGNMEVEVVVYAGN